MVSKIILQCYVTSTIPIMVEVDNVCQLKVVQKLQNRKTKKDGFVKMEKK